MTTVRTDCLEVSVEVSGPADGPPVLLLHGWPDAPRGWAGVARRLQSSGSRTITPYLRGSGPTRFLSKGRNTGTSCARIPTPLDFPSS